MFKWLESRVLWGGLLILAGVVFLIQNIIGFPIGGIFWGTIMGLGGLIFLGVFLNNREHWWALIPGFALVGIGATILISSIFPRLGDFLSGPLILGGIGIGFFAVYLIERTNWWAIIPAGVMTTLAVVAGLDEFFSGTGTGGIFFLGLGLTFAIVALLPTAQGKMNWAWIPAGILTFMGLIVMAAAENLFNYIWPIGLIALGIFFVYRAVLSR